MKLLGLLKMKMKNLCFEQKIAGKLYHFEKLFSAQIAQFFNYNLSNAPSEVLGWLQKCLIILGKMCQGYACCMTEQSFVQSLLLSLTFKFALIPGQFSCSPDGGRTVSTINVHVLRGNYKEIYQGESKAVNNQTKLYFIPHLRFPLKFVTVTAVIIQ